MSEGDSVSVRQSLLAILDQGPCYGYQLRAEFDRRTGSAWPLNVGQIYNTLDRLERDGLVTRGDVDEQGHVYWGITEAGSREVRAWLAAPVARATARDDLAVKLAVAATLPGVDTTAVLRAQRADSQSRLDELTAQYAKAAGEAPPEGLMAEIPLSAAVFAAESEVRWLDHIAERIAQHPPQTIALTLAEEKPRRGRPAKVRSQ